MLLKTLKKFTIGQKNYTNGSSCIKTVTSLGSAGSAVLWSATPSVYKPTMWFVIAKNVKYLKILQ